MWAGGRNVARMLRPVFGIYLSYATPQLSNGLRMQSMSGRHRREIPDATIGRKFSLWKMCCPVMSQMGSVYYFQTAEQLVECKDSLSATSINSYRRSAGTSLPPLSQKPPALQVESHWILFYGMLSFLFDWSREVLALGGIPLFHLNVSQTENISMDQ